MKRKKLAIVTGLLSALGLAAFFGHQKQVRHQQLEEAILKEIRQFFEPMGVVEVIYTTAFDASNQVMLGGVVFDDQEVFIYRYDKGNIDYKLDKEG